MANINLSILLAAKEDGVFDREISITERVYFNSSVVTAFDISRIVKAEKASTALVAKKMSLAKETVRQFVRILIELKIVDKMLDNQ